MVFKMKKELELEWEEDIDDLFRIHGGKAKYMLEGNWKDYLKYFLEYFACYIKKDNSKTYLLDVGCGAGLISRELSKMGFQVCGIDFSSEAINLGRSENHEINFQHASIYKLPFSSETFDIIICLGVFQTVTYPERALVEMTRVLKKGGILIMRTLNILSLSFFKSKKNNPSYNFYNPFLLKKEIEKIGFKVYPPKGIYFPPKKRNFMIDLIIKTKIYRVFNLLFFPIFVFFSHSFYIEAKKNK